MTQEGALTSFALCDLHGGPKRSPYQESSFNRIKTANAATFLINFEYKMSTRIL